MAKLTQVQLNSWRRTRAKGRTRIVLEQFFAGSGIGFGVPTLRALLKGGGSAVAEYWNGAPAIPHVLFGLAVGTVMAYVFGFLAWTRMERLYADATPPANPTTSQDGIGPHA